MALSEVPDTRDSLLVQIRDPRDHVAWEEFSRVYRPVVYRLARSRGIQDADAQDLAQRVLMSVASAIGSWRRNGEGTKFRHWLRRVARNETFKFLTRRPQDLGYGGSSAMNILNASAENCPSLDEEIELEYRRQLIRRAAEIVRERVDETTWLAFSRTMVDGLSISDVAKELKCNEGTVYTARSRMVRRIRAAVCELEEDL